MRDDISVSVDPDFARFGSKSYAIDKINSVEVRQHRPNHKGPAVVSGFLCFAMVMVALGGGPKWQLIAAGSAVVFALLAYLAWKQAKVIEYQLFLTTSSSESQALKSRNGELIQRLRAQIESAMSGRLTT